MTIRSSVVSVGCACAIAALLSATAFSEDLPQRPAVIRTPLGRNSSEVLFAKITVSDLAKSYEFYTNMIGLKWAVAPGQLQPAPPQATDMRPAFVEIPLNFSGSLADPFFVLVQRRGDKPKADTAQLSWIGFKVPDAPAVILRVKAAGYEIVRQAPSVGPGEMSIGSVRDPDGYSVEIIQAANYPATQ
jgi:catechol 2,3-dioxygenase-like lactoylglutathione lyase family enzyme